jgi:GT2 family glycosyltransferase
MIAMQSKTSSIVYQSTDHIPMRILEVELGQPLPPITAFDDKKESYYQCARCLIRLHTQPLGLIELKIDKEELSPDEYAPKIWQALKVEINEHLQQDGLPKATALTSNGLISFSIPCCIEEREKFLNNAPLVSVIVPTHDRPEQLATSLSSLMSLYYPHYEVIVVDNAPSTNATADLVHKLSHSASNIKYVREDRPGPSWARNCGIKVAEGKILAFVDDDVVVDCYWLVDLVRGFGFAENVACVTGLILPLELETPAQFLFEEYGGFSRGFTRRVYDMEENRSKDPLYPYAGHFGTGASMAFTADFIRCVGGFDPALGGSGPVRCSQDVAVFLQVLTHGYKLVYQPAALVYHLHRRDYIQLRKQIYNYGVGITGHLTKTMLENPRLFFDFVTKIPYALFYKLSAQSPNNKKKSPLYPKELIKMERKGLLYGPFAYLQSRRNNRPN